MSENSGIDQRPVEELDDHPRGERVVPADDPRDATLQNETLGIDNTDTALAPEDASTPVEPD